MTADEIIAAVVEALERSGGMDVVYIHADGTAPAIATIVRAGSSADRDLHRHVSKYEHAMLPHSHIEPEMF